MEYSAIISIIFFFLIALLYIILARALKYKRQETSLLRRLLRHEIKPLEINISEPSGDGYQVMNISYIDNNEVRHEELATHFQIPKISKILTKYNIPFKGEFIRK